MNMHLKRLLVVTCVLHNFGCSPALSQEVLFVNPGRMSDQKGGSLLDFSVIEILKGNSHSSPLPVKKGHPENLLAYECKTSKNSMVLIGKLKGPERNVRGVLRPKSTNRPIVFIEEFLAFSSTIGIEAWPKSATHAFLISSAQNETSAWYFQHRFIPAGGYLGLSAMDGGSYYLIAANSVGDERNKFKLEGARLVELKTENLACFGKAGKQINWQKSSAIKFADVATSISQNKHMKLISSDEEVIFNVAD